MTAWQWIDVAGYAASALVFCAFYMREMTPLRVIAIASNVAFIAYGAGRALYPVLILHAVLLPLNCLRLVQDRRRPGRLVVGHRDPHALAWLAPLLARRRCPAGEVLFGAGDAATSMLVVLRGTVHMVESGASVGPGSLVGELGVLAPGSARSVTAVCKTDAEIGTISAARVHQLCRGDAVFCLCLALLLARPPVAAVEPPLGARAGPPLLAIA